MDKFLPENMITVSLTLPIGALAAVYALLGGASTVALARGSTAAEASPKLNAASAPKVTDAPSEPSDSGESGASSLTSTTAAPSASLSDEIDADGHPWSAALHASTKAKTGAGLWRMKPGASRPAPLPGFPKEGGTGTSAAGTASKPTEAAATPAAATDEEDEFAAFTKAAAGAGAADSAAEAKVTARTWSDADLSKLANQAAQKLGSADPVRELVTQYTPDGVPVHSRNIPADQREAFAKALETKAGIEFAA